jgi:ElaA protein
VIHDVTFGELDAATLYALLRLRAEVFVVEQACAYNDVDGRDLEASTRHVWWGSGESEVPLAYLRILRDADAGEWRIGRVVTSPEARHGGYATRLMQHALHSLDRPVVLDAQSYLVAWYASFGFVVSGAEYLDDGIPHTPMRLE